MKSLIRVCTFLMCLHLSYKKYENQIKYVNQVNLIKHISIINKIHSAGTNQRLSQLGKLNRSYYI